jgi:hypothetical protein
MSDGVVEALVLISETKASMGPVKLGWNAPEVTGKS